MERPRRDWSAWTPEGYDHLAWAWARQLAVRLDTLHATGLVTWLRNKVAVLLGAGSG